MKSKDFPDFASMTARVGSVAQIQSFFGQERFVWGTGFVINRKKPGNTAMLTAGHVITGLGLGEPEKLSVLFRDAHNSVVEVGAKRVVWYPDWREKDVALILLEGDCDVSDDIGVGTVDDGSTHSGRLYGFADRANSGLSNVPVSFTRKGDWLSYADIENHHGFSGGPILMSEDGKHFAVGVHTGGKSDDGDQWREWGACALTSEIMKEMEHRLWQ